MIDLDHALIHDIEVYPNMFTDTLKVPNKDIVSYVVVYEDELSDTIYHAIEEKVGVRDIHRYISLGDYIEYLREFDGIMFGYNSYEYDDCIINWIARNYKTFSHHREFLDNLWNTSANMMSENYEYKRRSILRTCDLMRVGNLKAIFKPLKQVAGNLRFPNILEFKHTFGKRAEVEQIPDIMEYNYTDVLVTERLLLGIPEEMSGPCIPEAAHYGLIPAIQLRSQLSETYQVSLINETDSGMGNLLNNELYSRISKKPYSSFEDLRTGYESLHYNDIILGSIEYSDKELFDFIGELRDIEIDTRAISEGKLYNIETDKFRSLAKSQLTYKRTFCELPVTFGVGGLHSNQKPQVFEETDEYVFLDADVNKDAS